MPSRDSSLAIHAGLPIAGAVLLAVVFVMTPLVAGDVGDALTRNTVRLALAWYAAALFMMLRLGPHDWAAATPRGQIARWCWSLALITFLVHLGVAFHYFDHWSHQHALERTRQVSGVAEGLYVSYLFTLLWLADVGWWWLRPQGYAHRSSRLHRGLQAFMLMIVANGTIVFESGPIRWVAAGVLLMLAVAWWKRPSAAAGAP